MSAKAIEVIRLQGLARWFYGTKGLPRSHAELW